MREKKHYVRPLIYKTEMESAKLLAGSGNITADNPPFVFDSKRKRVNHSSHVSADDEIKFDRYYYDQWDK